MGYFWLPARLETMALFVPLSEAPSRSSTRPGVSPKMSAMTTPSG